jgi:hypothetical protein
VTDCVYCQTLSDWFGREAVPGNSPPNGPVPVVDAEAREIL